MEDIIEELVGEIDDESDHPVREIQPIGDGIYRVLGSVEMRKLAAELDVDWDTSTRKFTPSAACS